ncbi:ABC-F family ATP-binding cassette domain-containing protein [Nocardiopsis sp. HNM0947]|uniref:ABC-F family ATP-binding cassette domain-containing protein n=1 Tax=Nocardiopsis coralli TaxID=2772213 RepID=A0ABR9P9P3_9ACTN|nr:ABC-F family ATP-binding cassette domain-containing protein [Nocardiopsis coralli]MBE3000567.1 ABC-F family ATP-binding cassette domain-containing protein [Nocardiopsis coralli]
MNPHTTSAPSGAATLSARDLSRAYGTHVVLDGIGLDVAPGQRLGLVGENGSGKSTLLRLLAGTEDPDSGSVERPDDTGFLHQELPYGPGHTLGDVVADALAPAREVEQRLARCAEAMNDGPGDEHVLAEYADALSEAERLEVWDADRRADLVVAGLGIDGLGTDRTVERMSGGQRARLALAALLIRRPRALLLDEPTNHLDDAALEFLEGYLRGLPGLVVLASHDRVFLDAVCTGLIDLDPAVEGPVFYGGAYTYYLHEKKLERERWEQRHQTEQERLKALRESVRTTARKVGYNRQPKDNDKMNYDATGERVAQQVSRRVRDARGRLEALERDQVRKPPRKLSFSGHLTARPDTADGQALMLRDAQVPGRLSLSYLDVPADGRLLVTGPNGAGKSTLLYTLARRLTPVSGTVTWARGATVALLEQDVEFTDPERTPRSLYEALNAGRPDAPRLVELGLVAPRDQDRPVGLLSVGQRRRLALAMLVGHAPDVLLLDEPTNHLSLSLSEELEEALGTAPGAVVVASHDRWLRRNWEGEELRLVGGAADH